MNTVSLFSSKPYPNLSQLGLSFNFLSELLIKHLHTSGILNQRELVSNLAIPWNVIETILVRLKREASVEPLLSVDGTSNLRYKLTDKGRSEAIDAIERNGYVGYAPVPLDLYTETVKSQSVRNVVVTKESILDAFGNTVLDESVLSRVGPAMNSGRPIFIYGPSGTGKTYVTKKLTKLLGDEVLIPYAINVNNLIVQVFDPIVHKPIQGKVSPDPRYALCRRPEIITGGELTIDMLEIQYDPNHKIYRAPLQLKATNGLYIIDDLGRQKAGADEILNRWIVPLEEKIDYLTFGTGQRFPVIFDVILVFSTNVKPRDLADEAFLRRLGYKIKFDYCSLESYVAIWKDLSLERSIPFDEELLIQLIRSYYSVNKIPLLPCHPRDLLQLISDTCKFQRIPPRVNSETWKFAIDNYFVSLNE